MSTTIDQNVVEMRFDNKHFESNVSTSMSTLDKLKQKLRFDGATKGLENVNSAAGKVNMSGLGSGVEAVHAKFSALEVMGVTALANITNSAVNAGKRIVSALTIDPVRSGFQEYEMKMDSIKVIMNSTGRDIADVNKLLNELNEYSDQTIYSFRDMTQNIGKFTNAGVGLEDAVLAIKGISNEAALSGANANEASRAMYNFSQALSAGYVKLIDWKSIENANMATKEFKQQLIDTAVELGVVTKSGDMYTTQTGKSFNATKNFNEVLQEQWMTTDVLIKTLGKYADENTEIGKKAFAAAQEVTKFTQMWDVLKETAQSGWARTWELIIGDINTAKSILTPLTNFIGGFIDKMSDARNRVLQIALDFAAPWKAISDKLKGLTKVTNKVKGVAKNLEYFQDVVNKVWRGDYNNWGDNPDRFDLLEKAGYDHRVVQDLVNKGYKYKLTIEDVEASHKKFGLTMETTTEETKEVTKAVNELTDKQLKNAGLTDDEIRLYRALEKEASRLGISVSDLADEMSKTSGRDLLIGSFKDLGSTIAGVGKAIKEAWVDIFNPPSTEEMGIRLYGMIKSLKKFTESLRLTDEKTGKLNANGEKLKRTFAGILAIIDILVTVIGGPLKIAFKFITAILEAFGFNILDVTSCIGDFLVKIRDGIDGLLDFSGVAAALVNPIKNAIKAFKEWIASLKESENLPQDIAKGIARGFGKAFEAIKNFFKQIPGFFKNGFSSLSDSPISGFVGKIINGLKIAGQTIVELGKIILKKINGFLSAKGFKTISEDSIAGLVNGFKNGASKVWNAAVEIVKILVEKVRGFLGIESPSKVFFAIGGFIVAGLIAGLQNGIPDSLGAVKDLFQPMLDWIKGIDFGAVVASVFTIGTTAGAYKAIDSIHNFSEMFSGVGYLLKNTGKLVKNLTKPIKNVVDGFAKIEKALAFEMRMDGIKTLATAIVMLAAAVLVLSFIKPAKLWGAVGAIAVLTLILAGLAFAMDRLNKTTATASLKDGIQIKGLTSGLASIGIAILLLGITAKLLGSLDGDTLKQGLLSLAGIMTALVLVMVVMGKVSKGANAMSVKTVMELGKMMKALASALLKMAIVVWLLGSMDQGKLIQGGLAIIAFSGIIVGLMAATKLMGPQEAASVGKMMKNFGSAILLMSIAVLILGNIDRDKLIQAGAAILAFGGIIVGLMAATKLIGTPKRVENIGKSILAISGAIAILGLTAFLLSLISPEGFWKGLGMITAFGIIIAGLMWATKLAGGKKAEKIGTVLLSVAGAIAILAALVIIFAKIDPAGLNRGLGIITVLTVLVAGLIFVTKYSKNCMGTMFALAAVIAALAGAVYLMSLIPAKSAIVSGLVLAGLLVVMTLLLKQLAVIGKSYKSAFRGVSALAALAISLLPFVGALILMNFAKDAVKNALVLITLATAMTLLLKPLTKISKQGKKALKGALALTSVAVPLLAFVGVLAVMQNVGVSIKNVMALTLLAAATTLLLMPLTLIGTFGMSALKGALSLTAMAVPLIAFVGVLAVMQNVQNAMSNVQALVLLTTTLTLLLIPLTIVGMLAMSALIGIVALTAMAIPMLVFIGVLALMSGIENATANANILIGLMSTIGDVLFKLSLVAPLALVAVAAVTALVGVITLFGLLVIAIGALVSNFPQLQTFLDVGIPIMVRLAGGLGQMIGAFVAALAESIMQTLPTLGTYLSQFMTNATPFIEGAKLVDGAVLKGVGILASAILALTVADLINGVVSFLQGGSSFADLGAQLSQFIMNALPFIMIANTITPDMVSGVKALAETILIITAANVLEGLTSFITGGSSLENFAKQLPLLGQGLAAFSASISTFGPDQLTAVNSAAQAIKTLAEASREIPNSGGLLAAIVGDNDLGTFASQFPVLGTGIRSFLTNVGTLGKPEMDTISCGADAVKALATVSQEIPNSGGLLAAIVGDNDLGTFAAQFPVLGSGLRGFLTNVGTFTPDEAKTVQYGADAVKALATVSKSIPNEGGLWSWIVGDNSLGDFANQFPVLGSGLRGFLTAVGTFTPDQVATVKCGADAVKTLAEISKKIPNEGGLWSWIVGDNSLGDFANQFPKLGEGLASFLEKIGTFTTAQVDSVRCAVDATAAITGLANSNLKSLSSNIGGLGDKLPKLATNISTFCTNMPAAASIVTATSNLSKIISSIKEVSAVDSGPLVTLATNLSKVGKDAVKKFVEAFTSDSAKKNVSDAAEKLGDKVVDGLESKESTAKTAGEAVAKKAVSGLETQNGKKGAAETAGKNLGAGYIEGINAKKQAAYDAGFALGKKAAQGINDGQDSNSPSKLAAQSGKWLGEGYVIGIGKMGKQVDKAGNVLGSTATDAISSTVSRIASLVNTDIDSQPTIRPIMDLTDVESGANALSNMLNMDSRVGVMANVGTISSMMNSNSQNGANDDVVSAIKDLNKKLDNVGGTSYNINGVTYDDGSNITEAVRTIVHAAQVGRRV